MVRILFLHIVTRLAASVNAVHPDLPMSRLPVGKKYYINQNSKLTGCWVSCHDDINVKDGHGGDASDDEDCHGCSL